MNPHLPPCPTDGSEITACCVMVAAQPDVSALVVCPRAGGPAPVVAIVPALSGQGLAVTVALIACAGFLALERRS